MNTEFTQLKNQLQLNLTPKEILDKDFKIAFRGYDRVEVDEFLDLIIKDYQKLLEEFINTEKHIYQNSESSVSRYEFERLKQQVEYIHNRLSSERL